MPTSELDMFTEESQSRQGSGAGKRRESGRVGASPDAAGERSPALPDLLPVKELVPLPTEFPPSTLERVLAAVDGAVAVGKHYFPFMEDLRSCFPYGTERTTRSSVARAVRACLKDLYPRLLGVPRVTLCTRRTRFRACTSVSFVTSLPALASDLGALFLGELSGSGGTALGTAPSTEGLSRTGLGSDGLVVRVTHDAFARSDGRHDYPFSRAVRRLPAIAVAVLAPILEVKLEGAWNAEEAADFRPRPSLRARSFAPTEAA